MTTNPWRTLFAATVPEKGNATFTATLKDDTGTVIPGSALTTLVCTLYDRSSGVTLNNRNAQSILGLNGGSVSSPGGVLTLQLLSADNVLQSQDITEETHIALIEGTYNAGAKALKHELVFVVVNLTKVT